MSAGARVEGLATAAELPEAMCQIAHCDAACRARHVTAPTPFRLAWAPNPLTICISGPIMARQMAPRPVFTLEEANALVPRLKSLIGAQMERRAQIERGLEQLAKMLGAVPDSIRVDDEDPAPVRNLKRDVADRIEKYRVAWREVEELGVVLKDARAGLVDFYGQVDGKAVWLCWKYGEEAVTHYHGLDEGFAGRKPIAATLRHRHLN